MYVRLATMNDLPEILQMIENGKKIMRNTGNYKQWSKDYPNEVNIIQDIRLKQSYLVVSDELENELLLTTFVVMKEPEPSYEIINGAWLNDEPYVTIHRLATNQKISGTGKYSIEWTLEQFNNVRIDTHPLNKPLLKILKQLNFSYCGEIRVADGTIRKAYQKTKK